jgi:NAD+ diphosphatase
VSHRTTLFTASSLDRRAECRDDPHWIATARADMGTRYVLGTAGAQLVTRVPATEVAFLSGDHPLVAGAGDANLILLGWFRGTRCVLVELPAPPPQESLPAGTELRELRPLAPQLPPDSATLLAYARSLGLWRARHRHCGVCGAPSSPARAGHVMRCTRADCGSEAFPRLDPAIIVLVTSADGERALLGRQAEWPAGRYSTIAGFVEPGESLEDAVVREVAEETGVQVGDVRYDSSQPWPFPSSLMLGFHAVARTHEITLRDGELEDARWFSRADIAAGNPALPPAGAISARLIDAWFGGAGRVPRRG